MSIEEVAEAGIGDGTRVIYQRYVSAIVLTCADSNIGVTRLAGYSDGLTLNNNSGPYYHTGRGKSVKIQKNSYGRWLCCCNIQCYNNTTV